jgi:hypothetical protein
MDRQKDVYEAVTEGCPFAGTLRVIGFIPLGGNKRTPDRDRAFWKRVKKRRAKKGYRTTARP